jgi:hypothetical protein
MYRLLVGCFAVLLVLPSAQAQEKKADNPAVKVDITFKDGSVQTITPPIQVSKDMTLEQLLELLNKSAPAPKLETPKGKSSLDSNLDRIITLLEQHNARLTALEKRLGTPKTSSSIDAADTDIADRSTIRRRP